jgi:hypothetical protein
MEIAVRSVIELEVWLMWYWSFDIVESFSDVSEERLRSGAESLSMLEARLVNLGARCAACSSSVMGPGEDH